MKKEWLREFARDFVALGGIPFFILVLVRVSLLERPDFFSQFIIAGVIFIILMLIFKSDMYSGLGLIVLVFTIIYYEQTRFTIFAILAYILLIISLFYLKIDKKHIFKGISFGVIGTIISYYAVRLIFNL